MMGFRELTLQAPPLVPTRFRDAIPRPGRTRSRPRRNSDFVILRHRYLPRIGQWPRLCRAPLPRASRPPGAARLAGLDKESCDEIRIGHPMHECVGKGVDDVAGDHPDLAVMVACDVSGQPWMKTPNWAASNAGSFWARSAAMTPVRTSPVPPVAIPGFPVVLI